jgi:Mg-chelatase subunit ChlD
MRILTRKRARSKGIAVLLTSVAIVGAMTIIGLAVDVGMMYAVKVKLSAAADAASLAAARAIGTASNGGASVSSTAQAYFAANFPAGYMLSSSSSLTAPAPVVNANNSETQTVTATATLPLMFLRFINFNNSNTAQTINTTAAASRRNLNLVMVLDRSGSMNTSGSCAPMVAAAQAFTNQFVDGQDSLGLVVFGGSYDVAYPMSKTFKSGSPTISSVIGSITCNGNTGSAQGISQAHTMLSGLPSSQVTGAVNAIVFFTDGQPNGLTANWPINTAVYQKSVTGVAAVNTPSYANSWGGTEGTPSTTSVSPWYTGYPVSGCSATATVAGIPTITGFIARNGEHQHGILGASTTTIGSDAGVVSNSTGCAFASGTKDSQGFSGQDRVHEDIAYIPNTDAYGNKTTGYWDTASGTTKQTIANGPYKGFVMLDFYQNGGSCGTDPCGLFNNNIDLASMNAAEDAANTARADSTTNIIVFSIGLGGAQDTFPGQFLDHVANTAQSDTFNSAQPSGQYIYVTGAGQLGSAFQSIASFVLRLSS